MIQPPHNHFPACFNPHPSRRRDATVGNFDGADSGEFQSSSLPKKGCNWFTTLRVIFYCRSFNPHPSRRRDATSYRRISRQIVMFQSSSLPKKGCNCREMVMRRLYHRFNPHPSRRRDATNFCWSKTRYKYVSILIPPEEGMQPAGPVKD